MLHPVDLRSHVAVFEKINAALPRVSVRLLPQALIRGTDLRGVDISFAEWASVFGDAKMTTALLDRLTHRCHILETGNDSYRFRNHVADTGKER